MTTLVTLANLVAAEGGNKDNPIADFSDTPLWLSALKALLLFAFLMVNTLIVIWFERRVIGRMQQRPGPNRTGPFGLLQTLADGVKLALKEDLTPKNADKLIFIAAPAFFGAMAFISFSIIPLGPDVWMFGHRTPLQLTDLPIAVLLVLAVAGVGAYGVVLAGWASGSTYPLLGGLRSTAQIISYEIAMGLALVAVFLYAGSMSTSQIVYAQKDMWFILPAILSFVIYVVTMVGETNRLPVDLAEGEGELTGGFHTEYSSLKFAMFFLGEYVNMFTVSGLATTVFLGGWQAPPGIAAINDGMFNEGWWGLLWFILKVWGFMFFFVWLRGSLPRHPAPGALRPVHALRLEVPHPRDHRLGRRGCVHPRLGARLLRQLDRRRAAYLDVHHRRRPRPARPRRDLGLGRPGRGQGGSTGPAGARRARSVCRRVPRSAAARATPQRSTRGPDEGDRPWLSRTRADSSPSSSLQSGASG